MTGMVYAYTLDNDHLSEHPYTTIYERRQIINWWRKNIRTDFIIIIRPYITDEPETT